MPLTTIIIIGALGWSVGALQHFACLWGFAASSRRPLFAVLGEVYGAIHEHVEDGWIKVTPSLLLEVLSCYALLPFAQTVISCSDASLGCGADGVFRTLRNSSELLWHSLDWQKR